MEWLLRNAAAPAGEPGLVAFGEHICKGPD